jgi:ketopantoate reductase
MLRDIEQGRPIEIQALVVSVVELGEMTGTPVPNVAAVYACARRSTHDVANLRWSPDTSRQVYRGLNIDEG